VCRCRHLLCYRCVFFLRSLLLSWGFVPIGDTGTTVSQGLRSARAYFIVGASGCLMKKTRKKCRALIPRSTRSAPTRLGYRNAGSQEHQSPNTFDELLKIGHAPINALRHSAPLGSLGEWRTAPGWEEGTILGLVHRPVFAVSIENRQPPKLASALCTLDNRKPTGRFVHAPSGLESL